MRRLVFLVFMCCFAACGGGGGAGSSNDDSALLEGLSYITVTPAGEDLATGQRLQYVATGYYNDNTEMDLTEAVTWSVSDQNSAVILNKSGYEGLLFAMAAGSPTVTATFGDVSDDESLTINGETFELLSMSPELAVVEIGSTLELTFTGEFSDDSEEDMTPDVILSSLNTNCAQIGIDADQKAILSGINRGMTYVEVVFGDYSIQYPVFVISDFQAGYTILGDNTFQFTAWGVYGASDKIDMTAYVTWESNDTAILSFSDVEGEEGLAEAHGTGEVEITATYNDEINLMKPTTIQ